MAVQKKLWDQVGSFCVSVLTPSNKDHLKESDNQFPSKMWFKLAFHNVFKHIWSHMQAIMHMHPLCWVTSICLDCLDNTYVPLCNLQNTLGLGSHWTFNAPLMSQIIIINCALMWFLGIVVHLFIYFFYLFIYFWFFIIFYYFCPFKHPNRHWALFVNMH